MDYNTLFYFTDASVIFRGKGKKPQKGTFGIVKLMFNKNQDISFHGGCAFNSTNTDINVLEMMAIIGSLLDIGITRHKTVKIITDSNNCYYALRDTVLSKTKKETTNLSRTNISNKEAYRNLTLFAAERYLNLITLTYDISIDIVKSHVHSFKQLDYLKKYYPDIDIEEAVNYNRGNMIIDDIVHAVNDTNIIEIPYINPEKVIKEYLDLNQIQTSLIRKLIPSIH